jgi:hypothetical protein
VRVVALALPLAAALALVSAPPAGAVIGGNQVSITAAPWQVEVISLTSSGFPVCGGVIVGERLVLTAAHCVEGSLYTNLVAGVSEYNAKEATEQPEHVTGIRIDPEYSESSTRLSADDVAVLEVETPFSFSGAAVREIGLAPAGTPLPEGTGVALTGFGQREAAPESNETLNLLDTSLVSSTDCGGGASALFLCTKSSTGSTCFGDSGSGLILPGTPVTLIGLVDRLEPRTGEPCAANSVDAFVNLTAPAIQKFIGVAPTTITKTTTTSSTSRTTTTSSQTTVKAPARSAVRAVGSGLSSSNGSAVVDLACSGTATCRGTVTLTATQTKRVKGKRRKVSVNIGTESFSIAGGSSAKVKVKLSSYARAQVKATHGHLHASLELLGRETEPTRARVENVTIL